ncbi:hypothetical protein WKI71_02315 [Streptomyces sp. MS1.AVA.1]|uniref:Acyltransferase domain-containing protein n=1 Tax=Streptomyces machairae TaxID=3134109 RepID=A0ABU8UG33_9ACTN
MLEPVLDPLGDAAKTLTVKPAAVPMLSTVTGDWRPDLTPAYWQAHAVRPVRFGAAVARLLEEGYDTFVELGPGNTLVGAVRAVARAQGVSDVSVSTTGIPSVPDRDADPSGAGRCWRRQADCGRAVLPWIVRLWTGRPGQATVPRCRSRRIPSSAAASGRASPTRLLWCGASTGGTHRSRPRPGPAPCG